MRQRRRPSISKQDGGVPLYLLLLLPDLGLRWGREKEAVLRPAGRQKRSGERVGVDLREGLTHNGIGAAAAAAAAGSYNNADMER